MITKLLTLTDAICGYVLYIIFFIFQNSIIFLPLRILRYTSLLHILSHTPSIIFNLLF